MESNVAWIVPLLPGRMTDEELVTAVQPHEDLIFLMERGASPLFLTVNAWTTFFPWRIDPKSNTDRSTAICGAAYAAAAHATRMIAAKDTRETFMANFFRTAESV